MFETRQSRWRALQTRNPLAASAFVYAVATTRIYCRPTCPSRLARQANISFFDSATDAEYAGFRACKRCKPSQSDFEPKRAQHDKAVRKACELMDAAGGRLTLENLASNVGLSPRYFHGIFKSLMGVTPSVYAMRVRNEKAIRASLGSEERETARMLKEAPRLGRDEGEGNMLSENGFMLTEVTLSKIPPGLETSGLGRSSLASSHCGNIDGCFPGPVFLTSENILDAAPMSLDDGEPLFTSLGYAELHGTGDTVGHGVGIPSATQLPDTLFCSDLPSTYSWGWVA